MCLILMSYKKSNNILVIAANRDEYYSRPTSSADFWDDNSNILAGRDLLQMGTWLGINRQGNLAALTNYRDPELYDPSARSRGELVSNFLWSDYDKEEYLQNLYKDPQKYNPFSILLGDMDSLYYYSNMQKEICKLEPGIYGLSNHLLDTPWTKVSRGKAALEKAINESKDSFELEKNLFEILADKKEAPDEELPETGIGMERERNLSPAFISGSDYGTRSSSVILVDTKGKVSFIERTYTQKDPLIWTEKRFEIKIL